MRIATSEGQSERQSENKIIIINLITLISIVANIIILPAGRYHVMTDYGDGMLTWSDAQARVAKGLTSFDSITKVNALEPHLRMSNRLSG